MTNRGIDLQRQDILPEKVAIPTTKSFEFYQTRLRFASHSDGSLETLRQILRKLERMDVPGKAHVADYGSLQPQTEDDV